MQNSNQRAEGGILPGMPSLPGTGGGGGSEAGMMFNQPMAMMGGFSMLMMPAQDAMAMAQSFQQFMSSMPSMPSLPTGKWEFWCEGAHNFVFFYVFYIILYY
jgi:hypothetical protein